MANLFVDSGAFSAFKQGVNIEVEDYIAFLKQHKKEVKLYANLDVIGDARATWKNQRIMEKAGLSPLPTFHYGEPVKWLRRYLSKYDYIALGGMVPISTRDLLKWCDHLFAHYLTDKEGMPIVKVHGFGMTSLTLMLRYPWYSVDSTSWSMTGNMGVIYVPVKRHEQYDYTRRPFHINVSTRSPNLKDKNKHLETLSPNVKKMVLDYIDAKGFILGSSRFVKRKSTYKLKEDESWFGSEFDGVRTVEVIKERGLRNCHILRRLLNLEYMKDLEKTFPKWPWRYNKKNRNGFDLNI